jgi:hypothetical protein
MEALLTGSKGELSRRATERISNNLSGGLHNAELGDQLTLLGYAQAVFEAGSMAKQLFGLGSIFFDRLRS